MAEQGFQQVNRRQWNNEELPEGHIPEDPQLNHLPRGIEDIPIHEVPTHCANPGLFLAQLRQRCRPIVVDRCAVKPRNKHPDIRPIDSYKSLDDGDAYTVVVEDSPEGRRFIFHKKPKTEEDSKNKQNQPSTSKQEDSSAKTELHDLSESSTSDSSSSRQ